MSPTLSELLVAGAMAAAAGLVGSVAVMRRMALASDALSHVALPGIGVALLVHLNPLLGGLAALLIGTLLVWAVEHRTRLPTEAVIGVVFSAALAIGSILTSGEDLLEALFGAPRAPGPFETTFGIAAAVLVIGFMQRARSRLVIRLISPDLARTTGINVARIDLLFLLAFALTVALGLRYLGVLLMGSLIIIPATTAAYLGRDLRAVQSIAVVLAVAATLSGSLLAPRLHLPAGPLIIVITAVLFLMSLLGRRRWP